jgi:hypothetical protein
MTLEYAGFSYRIDWNGSWSILRNIGLTAYLARGCTKNASKELLHSFSHHAQYLIEHGYDRLDAESQEQPGRRARPTRRMEHRSTHCCTTHGSGD